MPRDLNVRVERIARVSQKLLVFLGTIGINNFAANLRVPTILSACSRVEIDRVAICARLRCLRRQRMVLVEIPRRHTRARKWPRVRHFPSLFPNREIKQSLVCVETGVDALE